MPYLEKAQNGTPIGFSNPGKKCTGDEPLQVKPFAKWYLYDHLIFHPRYKMKNTENNKTTVSSNTDGDCSAAVNMNTNKIQKFINDQKEFIVEISSIGTSKGFKQTLSDFRDDIDKFINTLDFDERYLLKKKFDDEIESIFDTVDSKKIPHSDYVCQMFCEVVDDGINSGINRIRIKSELKKSTNEIHSIEDLLFANNSVEKRNGWFKNIDVDLIELPKLVQCFR